MSSALAGGLRRTEAPATLRLADDEIHLWSANLALPEAAVAALAACLSPDEHSRAARFHFERDRRRFAASRATLRIVLSSYGCGDARQLRFSYGERGKPALDRAWHAASIEFNLAHSHDLVLVAVGRGQALGVDVEFVRPMADLQGVAGLVCSPAELSSLLETPPAQRCESFLRCWTRKEAYVKAIGAGLSLALDRLHVGCATAAPGQALPTVGAQAGDATAWRLHDLRPAPGYIGALATRQPACRITSFGFGAGGRLLDPRADSGGDVASTVRSPARPAVATGREGLNDAKRER